MDIITPEPSSSSCTSPFTAVTPDEGTNIDFAPRKRTRTSSVQSTMSNKSATTEDFLRPLNQLVANVSQVPTLPTLPSDSEQWFGNQVAHFLRGLNEQEKYVSQLYIMTHMADVVQNKKQ